MRIVIVTLFLIGIVALQLGIGGTYAIFALFGLLPISLAAVISIWPKLKTSPYASMAALLTTFLFIGYILVRNRLSPVEFIAREQFMIGTGCLLVYLLFSLVLTGQRERTAVFVVFCLLALGQVVIGAIQFKEQNQWMPIPWAARGDDWWRASGLYISPNHFAGFLEVVAVTAFAATFWSRFKVFGRVLSAYVGLVCIAGIAISGSRGSYLSLAAGLGLLLILSLTVLGRLKPEKLLTIGLGSTVGLLGLFGGAVAVASSSEFVRSRLSNIADTENIRFQLWDMALQQFSLSPIFGTGGFTFVYFGRMFRHDMIQNDPIHVHNDYLQLLAEYGLVGAALFLVFLLTHLVVGLFTTGRLCKALAAEGRATSNQLWLTMSAICAVGAYVVHSVVDFNMHIVANAYIMASFFGILAGGAQLPNDRKTRPDILSRAGRIILFALGAFLLVWGGRLFPSSLYEKQAKDALEDREPARAYELASKGLEIDPFNTDLYYYAAESARVLALSATTPSDQERYRDRSLDLFRRGREIYPYDSRLAFKYAHALSDAGLPVDAAIVLDDAEVLDPSSYLLPAYRGIVELQDEYFDEAIEYFEESIKMSNRRGRRKDEPEFFAVEGIRRARRGIQQLEAEEKAFQQFKAQNPQLQQLIEEFRKNQEALESNAQPTDPTSTDQQGPSPTVPANLVPLEPKGEKSDETSNP